MLTKPKTIIKRTVANICAGITACTSMGAFFVKQSKIDYVKNRIYQSQVAEDLDANMQLMGQLYNYDNWRNSGIVRLKPNDDKKIYVYVSQYVGERATKNIEKVMVEFNEIFSYINDDYHFATCNKNEYSEQKKNSNTVISFDYLYVEEYTRSGCMKGDHEDYVLETSSGTQTNGYIFNAHIFLNSKIFDELDDEVQLNVIKHEFLHTLGFGDMYDGYKDETSLMNGRLRDSSCHLSPNDIKMLYVAYGNKHINKDGSYNKQKVEEIKKLIDKYEVYYYDYLMKNVKKATNTTFQPLLGDEIKNLSFEKDGATIKINDNNEFEYKKDDYLKKGKIIWGEDYAILPEIVFDGLNNFLVLAKKDSTVECLDVKFEVGDFPVENSDEIIHQLYTSLE